MMVSGILYLQVRSATMKIYLGDLVMLKSGQLQAGESFKIGRAQLRADDLLRCISVEGDVRQFVSRRTGASFAFAVSTLATKFSGIGFDGIEDITC
jgi:hypothetical protein